MSWNLRIHFILLITLIEYNDWCKIGFRINLFNITLLTCGFDLNIISNIISKVI